MPPEPIVDLRSDTVTRPTPGMREAIARADVGDDALGDDPTVQRLEVEVAGLLGKERSLFFPSGIMANQTAVLVLSTPGTEVLMEATAHILDWEDGASAQWAGVQLRGVAAENGLLDPDRVAAAIRPPSQYQIRTSLLCLENTHNAAGGRVLPLDLMRRIGELAREHGLPVHLDGARLWNASAATGTPVESYAAAADTVMVTMSKGLGCPVGSLLAGPADTIEWAWRIRRRLGGGMRQSGLLAAAGLYALEHHRERLVEDHANARLLARLAGALPEVRATEPETNIVMLDIIGDDIDAVALTDRLAQRGARFSTFGPRRLRAVTHYDVQEDGIRRAVEALTLALRA